VSLARRRREPELMDLPGLDPGEHRRALDALGRSHAVSRSAALLWRTLRGVLPADGRPLRVLDLACGGGHVLVDLARRAARAGVELEARGLDSSPVALEYARALAARAGARDVTFAFLDVAHQSLPEAFDVVLCSLFLHHLDDDGAVALLRRMREAARRLVVVSDLRRTVLGHSYAFVGCRLISRSRVFHVDGPRSVEAAFTTGEARVLAARAGLGGARVVQRWPQRFLLTWRRDVAR
jgi:SAM-dependent methyltransferase